MIKWHPGYKVVIERNGYIHSCMECSRRHYYKVGEITTPRRDCGPLAVFETYEAAYAFVTRYAGAAPRVIYSCTYTKSPTKDLFFRYWYNGMRRIESFMSGLRRGTYLELPEGTDFANRVMLIERIET